MQIRVQRKIVWAGFVAWCVLGFASNGWAQQKLASKIPQVLDEQDELTSSNVLPDFSCQVADLFSLPGQPPAVATP